MIVIVKNHLGTPKSNRVNRVKNNKEKPPNNLIMKQVCKIYIIRWFDFIKM